jgi:hypothetical protein
MKIPPLEAQWGRPARPPFSHERTVPNRKYVALQVYMTAHSCRKLEKRLREQGVGKPKTDAHLVLAFLDAHPGIKRELARGVTDELIRRVITGGKEPPSGPKPQLIKCPRPARLGGALSMTGKRPSGSRN